MAYHQANPSSSARSPAFWTPNIVFSFSLGQRFNWEELAHCESYEIQGFIMSFYYLTMAHHCNSIKIDQNEVKPTGFLNDLI